MNEHENNKENMEFNLPCILLVTGFTFLLFTLLLKIVDGFNIPLFLWIGLTTFTLGLLTGASTLMDQASRKCESNQSS